MAKMLASAMLSMLLLAGCSTTMAPSASSSAPASSPSFTTDSTELRLLEESEEASMYKWGDFRITLFGDEAAESYKPALGRYRSYVNEGDGEWFALPDEGLLGVHVTNMGLSGYVVADGTMDHVMDMRKADGGVMDDGEILECWQEVCAEPDDDDVQAVQEVEERTWYPAPPNQWRLLGLSEGGDTAQYGNGDLLLDLYHVDVDLDAVKKGIRENAIMHGDGSVYVAAMQGDGNFVMYWVVFANQDDGEQVLSLYGSDGQELKNDQIIQAVSGFANPE